MNATDKNMGKPCTSQVAELLETARTTAREVLSSCGGGKTVAIGPDASYLVKALLEYGIDAYGVVTAPGRGYNLPGRIEYRSINDIELDGSTFDIVVVADCLETLSDSEVESVLTRLRSLATKSLFVRVAPHSTENSATADNPRSRIWWETRFFEAGFRKHPLYYRVVNYYGLEYEVENGTVSIVLEPVPLVALEGYPLSSLREERDLHMDMTREPGERSDAHIVRYQWAASFVRPGDTVLDAACGLGYGSYLIQKGTKASRTIGIDGSDYAIDYATVNYAAVMPGLEFRAGFLPEALAEIDDASVDIVISFETLEHVEKNEELLAEFRRILTPSGRVIVSVPNDWTDEDTGKDPNPFHLHVYNLDKLRQQVLRYFILDQLTAQSASRHKSGPGRKSWAEATRTLTDVAIDVSEDASPDAEWWLAVGMRNPIEGESIPFRETQFPVFDQPDWNVTTFGRDYKNPWLIRGMVDIGHRLRSEEALVDLARSVLQRSPLSSPDFGAALAVLGYKLLNSQSRTKGEVSAFEIDAHRYLNSAPVTPHGVRWSVSLWFLLGKLWRGTGRYDKAEYSLTQCTEIDPLLFSPLLANRSVEARLMLGLLCIHDNKDEAVKHWQAGIDLARRAVTASWSSSVGDVTMPAEFGLPELASILDHASSCAYALTNLADFETRPLWWYEWQRSNASQRSLHFEMFAMERKNYKHQIDACKAEVANYKAALDHCRSELQALQNRTPKHSQSVLKKTVRSIKKKAARLFS